MTRRVIAAPPRPGDVRSANDEPATEAETREYLLARSGRDFAPVLKSFVQAPPGSTPRHGRLSEFVRGRDLRGLQAELLLLGIISSGAGDDGWSTTLPIAVWARVFGTTLSATDASAKTAVSKTLTRLERRNLIRRDRRGRERRIRVTLLREDGSGRPYTRPGAGNKDRYLRLSHSYWREGWYKTLDLPATAMLLVAMHEKPGFELPTEKVPDWYGWSADTAERGLTTLIAHGLLRKVERLKKAPLSPTGLTRVNAYTLLPPFEQAPAGSPTQPLRSESSTSMKTRRTVVRKEEIIR